MERLWTYNFTSNALFYTHWGVTLIEEIRTLGRWVKIICSSRCECLGLNACVHLWNCRLWHIYLYKYARVALLTKSAFHTGFYNCVLYCNLELLYIVCFINVFIYWFVFIVVYLYFIFIAIYFIILLKFSWFISVKTFCYTSNIYTMMILNIVRTWLKHPDKQIDLKVTVEGFRFSLILISYKSTHCTSLSVTIFMLCL